MVPGKNVSLNWEQTMIAKFKMLFAVLIKKRIGFVKEYLASQ